MIEKGLKNRKILDYQNGYKSSKSHVIFQLYLTSIKQQESGSPEFAQSNNGTLVTSSVLNFIDLAGSEKIPESSADNKPYYLDESVSFDPDSPSLSPMRVKLKTKEQEETKYINKSLFFLTQVLKLKVQQQKLSGQSKFLPIPYRSSVLTKIIKSLITENQNFGMLICVKPTNSDYQNSQSTIKFGQIVREIQFNPTSNKVAVDSNQKQLFSQLSRFDSSVKSNIDQFEESKHEDQFNFRKNQEQMEMQSLRFSLQDASVIIKRMELPGQSFEQSRIQQQDETEIIRQNSKLMETELMSVNDSRMNAEPKFENLQLFRSQTQSSIINHNRHGTSKFNNLDNTSDIQITRQMLEDKVLEQRELIEEYQKKQWFYETLDPSYLKSMKDEQITNLETNFMYLLERIREEKTRRIYERRIEQLENQIKSLQGKKGRKSTETNELEEQWNQLKQEQMQSERQKSIGHTSRGLLTSIVNEQLNRNTFESLVTPKGVNLEDLKSSEFSSNRFNKDSQNNEGLDISLPFGKDFDNQKRFTPQVDLSVDFGPQVIEKKLQENEVIKRLSNKILIADKFAQQHKPKMSSSSQPSLFSFKQQKQGINTQQNEVTEENSYENSSDEEQIKKGEVFNYKSRDLASFSNTITEQQLAKHLKQVKNQPLPSSSEEDQSKEESEASNENEESEEEEEEEGEGQDEDEEYESSQEQSEEEESIDDLPKRNSLGSSFNKKKNQHAYASEDDAKILQKRKRKLNATQEKVELIQSYNPFTLSKENSLSQENNEYRYPFFSSGGSHEQEVEDEPKNRYRFSDIKFPTPDDKRDSRDKSPVGQKIGEITSLIGNKLMNIFKSNKVEEKQDKKVEGDDQFEFDRLIQVPRGKFQGQEKHNHNKSWQPDSTKNKRPRELRIPTHNSKIPLPTPKFN